MIKKISKVSIAAGVAAIAYLVVGDPGATDQAIQAVKLVRRK